MPNVIRIFIERDGMTRDEAIDRFVALQEEIMETINYGGGYSDVEDILLGEGLEMDYIMDFI